MLWTATVASEVLAVASQSSIPSFTLEQNSNNCYGDGPACWFRGRFSSASDCEDVCIADPACHSFVYVGETSDSFAHECRTRNDTVWSLVAEKVHTSGFKGIPPAPHCESVADCNNGGECTAGGVCRCDPTWRGGTCDTLNLLAAQSKGNGDADYVAAGDGHANTCLSSTTSYCSPLV